MSADFTFEAYADLLDAGQSAGYQFLTVREYLDSNSLPERFVVLRHDVDRKPENARKMARLEADVGVSSTYYFRTIEKTLVSSLIQEVDALGHEVGYHYEDLDRANGNVSRAHESFETHLDSLRGLCAVDTVCMHGNPLTPHDNREMWTDELGVETYDLLGEAYLSMDFEDVTYFSDTGRTWRDGPLKVKDHTMGEGEKAIQVDSTFELIGVLSTGQVPRLCLLAHPDRWADSYPELVSSRAKDYAVNLVKHGLNLVS